MAVLTAQPIAVTGTKPTFSSAAGGGDTFRPQKGLVLAVTNGDASAKTVTLVRPGTTFGQANPDVARSVPAGETWYLAVPREFVGTDGYISVTYSAVTSVTVALLKVS